MRLRMLQLLTSLICLASCAPPWHGEEGNHLVLAVLHKDSTGANLPLDSLGIRSVAHLESGSQLPLSDVFSQEAMNFNSRIDTSIQLLFPIDKSLDSSSFVLEYVNHSDTARFRYKRQEDSDLNGKWDILLSDISLQFLGLDSAVWLEGEINHPRIIGQLTIWKK